MKSIYSSQSVTWIPRLYYTGSMALIEIGSHSFKTELKRLDPLFHPHNGGIARVVKTQLMLLPEELL
jgi:hypothetical protein